MLIYYKVCPLLLLVILKKPGLVPLKLPNLYIFTHGKHDE